MKRSEVGIEDTTVQWRHPQEQAPAEEWHHGGDVSRVEFIAGLWKIFMQLWVLIRRIGRSGRLREGSERYSTMKNRFRSCSWKWTGTLRRGGGGEISHSKD